MRRRGRASPKFFDSDLRLPTSSILEEAKARVRAVVAEVLDDRKVGDVLYLLGDLLELEFQSSPLTKAIDSVSTENDVLTRAVLKSFLEADARSGPMCIVIDDLQNCHQRSLSMLQFLAHEVESPLLFLCSTRPNGSPCTPSGATSHARRYPSRRSVRWTARPSSARCWYRGGSHRCTW